MSSTPSPETTRQVRYTDGTYSREVEEVPTSRTADRIEAAEALAEASGHTLDDAILIVAALENLGYLILKERL